jgi:hypothetical protein
MLVRTYRSWDGGWFRVRSEGTDGSPVGSVLRVQWNDVLISAPPSKRMGGEDPLYTCRGVPGSPPLGPHFISPDNAEPCNRIRLLRRDVGEPNNGLPDGHSKYVMRVLGAASLPYFPSTKP